MEKLALKTTKKFPFYEKFTPQHKKWQRRERENSNQASRESLACAHMKMIRLKVWEFELTQKDPPTHISRTEWKRTMTHS